MYVRLIYSLFGESIYMQFLQYYLLHALSIHFYSIPGFFGYRITIGLILLGFQLIGDENFQCRLIYS